MIKIYKNSATPEPILSELSEVLRQGELLIIPTDTRYSLCCDALNPSSVGRLAQLKGIDPYKNTFSILCCDISQASEYVRLDDEAFKLLKKNTPGPFTFILPPSSSLPKLYKGRKEVGIRIPRHRFVHELIEYYGHPLTGFSLPIAQENRLDEAYSYHPDLIDEYWGNKVACIVDDGVGELVDSTIVSCLAFPYEIVREGVEVLKI